MLCDWNVIDHFSHITDERIGVSCLFKFPVLALLSSVIVNPCFVTLCHDKDHDFPSALLAVHDSTEFMDILGSRIPGQFPIGLVRLHGTMYHKIFDPVSLVFINLSLTVGP